MFIRNFLRLLEDHERSLNWYKYCRQTIFLLAIGTVLGKTMLDCFVLVLRSKLKRIDIAATRSGFIYIYTQKGNQPSFSTVVAFLASVILLTRNNRKNYLVFFGSTFRLNL